MVADYGLKMRIRISSRRVSVVADVVVVASSLPHRKHISHLPRISYPSRREKAIEEGVSLSIPSLSALPAISFSVRSFSDRSLSPSSDSRSDPVSLFDDSK